MTLEILFLFPRIHNIHLLKYLSKYLLHNEVNALQYTVYETLIGPSL